MELEFEVVETVPDRNIWLWNHLPVNKIYIVVRGPNPMNGKYVGTAFYAKWDDWISKDPTRYYYLYRRRNQFRLARTKKKVDLANWIPCDIEIEETKEFTANTAREVVETIIKVMSDQFRAAAGEIYDKRGLPRVAVSHILELNQAITSGNFGELDTPNGEAPVNEADEVVNEIADAVERQRLIEGRSAKPPRDPFVNEER